MPVLFLARSPFWRPLCMLFFIAVVLFPF